MSRPPLLRRISNAWHVLLGRPLVTGAVLEGVTFHDSPLGQTRVNHCEFITETSADLAPLVSERLTVLGLSFDGDPGPPEMEMRRSPINPIPFLVVAWTLIAGTLTVVLLFKG